MGIKSKIFLLLLFALLIWMFILSFETFKYPDAEEINKRLNYLERVINEPLDDKSEGVKLGKESKEFMLFTYSYSTYAVTNLSITDSVYRERAIPLIKESILKVLDPQVYSTYGIEKEKLLSDSIPHYSVLYLGHLNLMMGCYRLLSNDDFFDELNDNISQSLFRRYSETSFLNLESYTSSIWVPDNTVALASLKLHAVNTGSDYDSICTKWVEYAKEHYLHEETGVLFSTISPDTGEPEEEPRGSMLGWSIMFIYQFDSEFALELYDNYTTHFSDNMLAFRLFRERSDSRGTNLGDIDSGLIFLGYSIPANEFALGNAIVAGDYSTARKIERLINFGASEIEGNDELKYKVRFVPMNISPMAEALVLNSLTMTKWVED